MITSQYTAIKEVSMRNFSKITIVTFALTFLVFTGSGLAAEVMQTQEAETWDGIEVDLTSLKVKNSIVTVKFKIRNAGSEKQNVRVDYRDCYLMDETNQKKYYVLKDSDGLFISGPNYDRSNGGRFWFDILPGKAKNLWMKFPEPTDSPETVTIAVANVLPFEDVELPK